MLIAVLGLLFVDRTIKVLADLAETAEDVDKEQVYANCLFTHDDLREFARTGTDKVVARAVVRRDTVEQGTKLRAWSQNNLGW